MKYDGISAEARLLLSENRFRDSKDFYDENKEKIKQTATVPMRQIAAIIGEQLSSVDPQMCTDPVKMVSRVRRDTRFTKDQHLYRENMWVMFMRSKYDWPQYPCMWFEFTPRSYSLGVGLFMQTPALLEYWRKTIRENTDEFRKAVKSVEKTGAVIDGEQYKKPKDGCPEGLEKYYNCKSVYWIIYSQNLNELEDETIINKLQNYNSYFIPMYKYMLKVSDAFTSETGFVPYRRRK
ncbi:MAG: DUF2461 domain-containing protein [Clostridia bacterium]|nr:DUF2461 domain-containing protein [Clostridia bacterium]